MARSGISSADADVIVDVVRELRNVGVNNHRPTVRASIAIANIIAHHGAHARLDDESFQWACRDVLNVETAKVRRGGESLMPRKIDEIVRQVCERKRKRTGKKPKG
jgi:nitric oxide reductase NorQ protein